MYYCDTASTMPMPTIVKDFIKESLDYFGNPSAPHLYGKEAASRLELVQRRIAKQLSCLPSELIWTSGATESNNMAVACAVQTLLMRHGKAKLYYHPLAHKSVIEPVLAFKGTQHVDVEALTLDLRTGRVDLTVLQEQLVPQSSAALFLPYGNNELGWFEDFDQLYRLVKEVNCWMHLDAAQALGKITINLQTIPCDSMSFSGHKIGAPVGIGALFLRMRPRKVIRPLLLGGGQQEGRRSGTVPVLLIGAFECALNFWTEDVRLFVRGMQNAILEVLKNMKGIELLTHGPSLPHIVTFKVQSDLKDALALFATEVAFAKGSACSASIAEGSHILNALGYSHQDQQLICRLSFGPHLTFGDQEQLIKLIQVTFKG
jgi:cysteine desulfurase